MVLEEISHCTGCGKPRFTPGLCQDCQEKNSLATQLYDKIATAEDLLAGLYDLDGKRVEEISKLLISTEEIIQRVEHQIRELETKVILYKELTEEQAKQLNEVKEYAEDQRYNQPTMSMSLRGILKLKDCDVCGKLQENCTCCDYCLTHECGTCPQHGEFHSGKNPHHPCREKRN